jgi:hypothetical protein
MGFNGEVKATSSGNELIQNTPDDYLAYRHMK